MDQVTQGSEVTQPWANYIYPVGNFLQYTSPKIILNRWLTLVKVTAGVNCG